MAKKRVHELAKQYDMPSAEVMKRLNAYGLKVKASASAVDEDEAERALTGKPPRQDSNGKPAEDQRQRQPQQTGMGFDRPATETARQRLEERQQRAAEQQRKQQQPRAERRDRPDGGGPRRDGGGAGQGQQQQPRPEGGAGGGDQGGERRQRPTRSSLQGERALAEGRRHPGQLGVDGQGRRRVPRRPGPRDHQEAHEPGRDGHAHADAVR
jgi:translation initiation factor IF-2